MTTETRQSVDFMIAWRWLTSGAIWQKRIDFSFSHTHCARHRSFSTQQFKRVTACCSFPSVPEIVTLFAISAFARMQKGLIDGAYHCLLFLACRQFGALRRRISKGDHSLSARQTSVAFLILWPLQERRLILQKDQISPVAYSFKSLSEATGLSVNFWRREVHLGRLPYVRFEKAVRILHADLDAYLAERRRVKELAQNTQEESLPALT